MNGLDSLEGKQLVGVGARKSCPVLGAGCAMKSHLGRVGPALKHHRNPQLQDEVQGRRFITTTLSGEELECLS